jgi:hypothetical protein
MRNEIRESKQLEGHEFAQLNTIVNFPLPILFPISILTFPFPILYS